MLVAGHRVPFGEAGAQPLLSAWLETTLVMHAPGLEVCSILGNRSSPISAHCLLVCANLWTLKFRVLHILKEMV